MQLWEIVLLGVGLAMDAFAVSVCKGLAMRKVNIRQCIVIAFYFGGFQALMPVIGYLLGSTFAGRIAVVDHWIAFILLGYIGIKMIADAIKERRDESIVTEMDPPLDHKELFIMAIATSIDALAVGVTLSFLDVSIILSASVIGAVTFLICVGGVFVGNIFGEKYKTYAQIVGGAILLVLGLRILITHLLGMA